MSTRTYALTIQQSSGRISIPNYDRALNAYEKALGVKIHPRMYEIGNVQKRLHVHCLVTQDGAKPELTEEAVKKVLQKNHRHCLDFGPTRNKHAWLNYIYKDQPGIVRAELSSESEETIENCIPPNFDIRDLCS